ncbi:hypothetical protein H0H92_003097 [Tricholoma furcatifolium]|nr:hypothetical protein H0H92_003097 [Tricholoma furcatifolium]
MKDGDVLQLGVDYQGGAEDIYKSVKIKIELGREWQAGANAFNYQQYQSSAEPDDTQMPPIEVDAEPESEPDVGGSGICANSASNVTSKFFLMASTLRLVRRISIRVARVSLARAAYLTCDIILLDDPLSAVDAYVGQAILGQCILNGPLANRTRILVTHALHVLERTDYIYVMDNSVISEQGTYDVSQSTVHCCIGLTHL